jgi:uncharacterized protein
MTNQFKIEANRREFLAELTGTALLTTLSGTMAFAQTSNGALNIARVAIPSSVAVASEDRVSALNDEFERR